MDKIKNIIVCGLGAIGTYYADKISAYKDNNLKILVNKTRLDKYKRNPRMLNGRKLHFEYILPEDNKFKADLIIISTKSYSLDEVISNIKNFVYEDTIILSFLNGVTSEDIIYNTYPHCEGIYSYILGHTFFRDKYAAKHDGISKIYFGSTKQNDNRIKLLEEFFKTNEIDYCISQNIIEDIWLKFVFNCCVNQLSAITGYTFDQMSKSKQCLKMMKNISGEVSQIAKAKGISCYKIFYKKVLESLKLMCPEGKTSMLQDIESGHKTEIDIFGKTITRLGKAYNIDTPYNKIISEIIELL